MEYVRKPYHLCKKLLQMANLIQATVEAEIIKAVEDVNKNLKIGATVNTSCCPGDDGFSSHILLHIMSRLQDTLGIIIPNNVYIFHDKDSHKQLSIEDAAIKLIKLAKHGK